MASDKRYPLKSKTNPIGVAEYELNRALSADLQGTLPSPRQLQYAVSVVLAATKRRG